jgi:hypothetical protein
LNSKQPVCHPYERFFLTLQIADYAAFLAAHLFFAPSAILRRAAALIFRFGRASVVANCSF